MAVTMKDAVFWDLRTHFVPHSAEVFTAVTTNNAVYWDMRPCGSYKNRVLLRSVLRLLTITNVVPSSPIVLILMLEATRSSETLDLTRATRRHIPEHGLLQQRAGTTNVRVAGANKSFWDELIC
jgi:hypothetical protein